MDSFVKVVTSQHALLQNVLPYLLDVPRHDSNTASILQLNICLILSQTAVVIFSVIVVSPVGFFNPLGDIFFFESEMQVNISR